MTPGSPEYQAALDDFRARQGEAIAGSAQALIGGMLLLVVVAVIGLMMWRPPVRPGLGVAEGLLASYVAWGGVVALSIAYWTTRGARKRQP